MKMTVLDKIETTLRKNTQTPGISASKLARLTGTSRENAVKRISDLRTKRELEIYTNTRGDKTFYRLAV